MTDNPAYQFKKLNDLLSTSFNNVKFDIRDLSARFEVLKNQFSDLTADSVRDVLKEQIDVIKELHASIAALNKRIDRLESRSDELVEKDIEREKTIDRLKSIAQPQSQHSMVFKKPEASIYDIPKGTVKITKTDLKTQLVEITGFGINLSGFKLYNKNKKTFVFPDGFTAYGPVKIFSGKGKDTNTKLYWNIKRPLNEKGDVLTLADKSGRIISRIKSEPSFSFDVLK